MTTRTRDGRGLAASALGALAVLDDRCLARCRRLEGVKSPRLAVAAGNRGAVIPDYLYRDGVIADLEGDVRRHADELNTRMLAGQYLQRFRESPDVGDLLRAVAIANRAMQYQPRYNATGRGDACFGLYRAAQVPSRQALRG